MKIFFLVIPKISGTDLALTIYLLLINSLFIL